MCFTRQEPETNTCSIASTTRANGQLHVQYWNIHVVDWESYRLGGKIIRSSSDRPKIPKSLLGQLHRHGISREILSVYSTGGTLGRRNTSLIARSFQRGPNEMPGGYIPSTKEGASRPRKTKRENWRDDLTVYVTKKRQTEIRLLSVAVWSL